MNIEQVDTMILYVHVPSDEDETDAEDSEADRERDDEDNCYWKSCDINIDNVYSFSVTNTILNHNNHAIDVVGMVCWAAWAVVVFLSTNYMFRFLLMSELWHCLILLGVLEVFWSYATLIIFVDNNNNNGHSQRVSPSAPDWSGKEDIRVLRRRQRDKFSLPKDLCTGAAFQCCLVTRKFAGFWLHGLMIVPTLYLLNF